MAGSARTPGTEAGTTIDKTGVAFLAFQRCLADDDAADDDNTTPVGAAASAYAAAAADSADEEAAAALAEPAGFTAAPAAALLAAVAAARKRKPTVREAVQAMQAKAVGGRKATRNPNPTQLMAGAALELQRRRGDVFANQRRGNPLSTLIINPLPREESGSRSAMRKGSENASPLSLAGPSSPGLPLGRFVFNDWGDDDSPAANAASAAASADATQNSLDEAEAAAAADPQEWAAAKPAAQHAFQVSGALVPELTTTRNVDGAAAEGETLTRRTVRAKNGSLEGCLPQASSMKASLPISFTSSLFFYVYLLRALPPNASSEL